MSCTRRQFLGAALAAPVLLRPRAAAADPALVGVWGPRVRQPNIPIHVAALPGTTRSLCVFGRGASPTPGGLAWQYDWAQGAVVGASPWSSVPFPYDPMCGGGILDDDGALRFYGGRTSGAAQSARFDPATNQWAWGPWLSAKQAGYYSSALRTGVLPGYPHGAVLVAFGRRAWVDAYDAEEYSPTFVLPRISTLTLPGTEAANYPRMMPLPDGTVAMVGTGRQMRRFEIPSATWTDNGRMLWDQRYEGCATPIGESGYEFLLSGGDIASVKQRMEVVDTRTGVSRATATLAVPRWQHNTVVLPDGTVLLVGGRIDPMVLTPELYDPVHETVRTLATVLPAQGGSDQGPCIRAYHSVADLLDDGRVLWGGGVVGSKGQSIETFSPPYLFQGPRPTLGPPTGSAGYGQTVTLAASGAITQMVLMRSGVVSHGCNFEQKRLVCPFTKTAGTVTVRMPADSRVAPAGWYRVFALAAGVPSVGQWVRLT